MILLIHSQISMVAPLTFGIGKLNSSPTLKLASITSHDDVIKWKHFPRYWPCLRETTGHGSIWVWDVCHILQQRHCNVSQEQKWMHCSCFQNTRKKRLLVWYYGIKLNQDTLFWHMYQVYVGHEDSVPGTCVCKKLKVSKDVKAFKWSKSLSFNFKVG